MLQRPADVFGGPGDGLIDCVWYSRMFQFINLGRIPESRGLLSRRGRESRWRQSRQKTVSASHPWFYIVFRSVIVTVEQCWRWNSIHRRIGEGEGILEDAVEDDGLFRDDVSSVTPGSDNPQYQIIYANVWLKFAYSMDPFYVSVQRSAKVLVRGLVKFVAAS